MTSVLFVTSEVYPLIKTGGLADVSASLPAALQEIGHDVRILVPAYRDLLEKLADTPLQSVTQFNFAGARVAIRETRLPGTDLKLWLVDHANSFDRPGNPYVAPTGEDWADNAQRFYLFARAAAALAPGKTAGGWRPDIVHCNDWQAGLVPALLSLEPNPPASVFTVHNLSYRGLFPFQAFEALGLPEAFRHFDGLEFHGQLAFIKGGLVYADRITTVSPSYAREILTPAHGVGLDGLLRYRADAVSGILNGIDDEVWDPMRDAFLAAPFDSDNLEEKAVNKDQLRRAGGLDPAANPPLVGFIGRLVEQKGIDLLLGALPAILDAGAQLVILGSGESLFEEALRQAAAAHPRQISLRIGYDEQQAHRIEAGADLFLMPSRFEPCGLNQMYSQRYGTLPVVHGVGGLRDTVVGLAADGSNIGDATGFVFAEPTVNALREALSRAFDHYPDQLAWRRMQRNGMAQDFSWARSARAYQALYQEVLGAAGGP